MAQACAARLRSSCGAREHLHARVREIFGFDMTDDLIGRLVADYAA
jgi:hypothetical protein